MAKRFTDTDKWKDPWFYDLPGKMKLAWHYILDQCDTVGICRVNIKQMCSDTGDVISLEEFREHFDSKIFWLSADKIWVKPFVRFQYGNMKPTNKSQRGMMRRVIDLTRGLPLDQETRLLLEPFGDEFNAASLKYPPPDSLPTPSDPPPDSLPTPSRLSTDPTGNEDGSGNGNGNEDLKEESAETKKSELHKEDLQKLFQTWKEVLVYYNADRSVFEWEQNQIARQLQKKGFEATYLSLLGARVEPASDDFKPDKHVSLSRYFDALKFDRFVTLGAQARKKIEERERKEALQQQHYQAQLVVGDDSEPMDPEKIRELMGQARKALRSGGAA